MINRLRGLISHYLDIFYNKYYPLQILFRNRQRNRLINKNFTLLTGNCIAGYLYHQLGIPFMSPTINMMFLNADFKKFVLNLDHYLSLQPTPYVDIQYPSVPSAKLGDIILHFTHYGSAEEGIMAWEKRKQRINFKNLFILMSDKDLSKQDIEDLANARCKKIAIMTSKDYGLKHCLYLPKYKDEREVGNLLRKQISGKWKFEKYFDFVGWVNSDNSNAQDFYIE